MRKFLFAILVGSLLVASAFVQKGDILPVKAAPSIYQGDLVLTDNNVTTIEGSFDINGSIIVTENATLHLKNAFLNLVQSEYRQHEINFRDPLNGNPRLLVYNSTITSDFPYVVHLYDNSTGLVDDSIVAGRGTIYLSQNSTATISNSTITGSMTAFGTTFVVDSTISNLGVYESADVSVFNSTMLGGLTAHTGKIVVTNSEIEQLGLVHEYVNCSIANIGPGFFSFWDFRLNSSVVVAPEGFAPYVTVKNTTIDEWALSYNGSNATIINSTLLALRSSYGAFVWLVNSTADLFQLSDDGRFYVSWYLDVHVVDSIGQDVPSANVTGYLNAILAESKLTDAQAWTRLTLMEKMMNETGEYPVGNYTVEATYDIYLNNTAVTMTENQVVILTLSDFIIPEFPSLLVLPLFMMLTLAIAVAYKRKRFT